MALKAHPALTELQALTERRARRARRASTRRRAPKELRASRKRPALKARLVPRECPALRWASRERPAPKVRQPRPQRGRPPARQPVRPSSRNPYSAAFAPRHSRRPAWPRPSRPSLSRPPRIAPAREAEQTQVRVRGPCQPKIVSSWERPPGLRIFDAEEIERMRIGEGANLRSRIKFDRRSFSHRRWCVKPPRVSDRFVS